VLLLNRKLIITFKNFFHVKKNQWFVDFPYKFFCDFLVLFWIVLDNSVNWHILRCSQSPLWWWINFWLKSFQRRDGWVLRELNGYTFLFDVRRWAHIILEGIFTLTYLLTLCWGCCIDVSVGNVNEWCVFIVTRNWLNCYMVVHAAQVSEGERKETEEKRGSISTVSQLTASRQCR